MAYRDCARGFVVNRVGRVPSRATRRSCLGGNHDASGAGRLWEILVRRIGCPAGCSNRQRKWGRSGTVAGRVAPPAELWASTSIHAGLLMGDYSPSEAIGAAGPVRWCSFARCCAGNFSRNQRHARFRLGRASDRLTSQLCSAMRGTYVSRLRRRCPRAARRY